MEKCAPQNEWFFIRFVSFTSTLVYGVVWNQSLGVEDYFFRRTENSGHH